MRKQADTPGHCCLNHPGARCADVVVKDLVKHRLSSGYRLHHTFSLRCRRTNMRSGILPISGGILLLLFSTSTHDTRDVSISVGLDAHNISHAMDHYPVSDDMESEQILGGLRQ